MLKNALEVTLGPKFIFFLKFELREKFREVQNKPG
jgi:hypothetical protein